MNDAVMPRRNVVLGLLIGVPASIGFLLLAMRGVDMTAVGDALAASEVGYFCGALSLIACVYVVQSTRWRRIARRVGRLGTWHFLRFTVGAVALNNVIPGRPGEFFRAYWLGRRAGIPVSRAFATVVIDRTTDVMALLVLFTVSLPFTPHPTWVRNLYAASLVLVALAFIGLGAAWWYSKRSRRGLQRAQQADLTRSRIRALASRAVRGLADTMDAKGMAIALMYGIVAWGAWTGAAWAIAASLGIDLHLAEAMFVTAILNLGVAIPSAPGFVGTYQWLAVSALALFDVDRSTGFAFSVLMHAAWFVPTTLAGAAIGLTSLITYKRARRVEAEMMGEHAT